MEKSTGIDTVLTKLTYNSVSDTFGDGGVSWSAAFSHDEEVDSGVRASWGLQSNPPSTQVCRSSTPTFSIYIRVYS